MAARGVGRAQAVDRRRRRRRDKTALVLGGGGFTGGVYEIGALRALDLLAVNSTVNNFDVYVGTSAGSFIAALCANGVTPEEMMRVVTRQGKPPFKDIDIGDLLRPNLLEFARKGALMPLRAASLARQLLSQPGGVSLMDVVLGLADGLPSGLYTGAGIERYLHEVLSEPGRTDDFGELGCELYLTATDLDTCERVVFGVRGLRGRADLHRRAGLRRAADGLCARARQRSRADRRRHRLDDQPRHRDPGRREARRRDQPDRAIRQRLRRARSKRCAASARGASRTWASPQIGYQVFKLVAHQRLHELAKGWEERYPGVDIVLIEPEPTDELMFQTSMMSFTSRVEIARHGFESVTKQLAGEYERYQDVAERHGLDISAKRVRKVVEHFDEEIEEVSAWRKILEGTTGALLRQAGTAG